MIYRQSQMPQTLPHPVLFVGAGPGAVDMLTMRAMRALMAAEVVLHDRLVSDEILEIAQGARLIAVGKEGFGPSVPQDEITAALVAAARAGAKVVRLKGGDCGIFGRLEEEADALAAAGIAYEVIPGITASVAAAAAIGRSLTRRGRNAELRILTGHDTEGFAEQDWRALARPGSIAAIYMGKRAARFLQGRLMMHGADPETPVSIVENVSRQDQRIVGATLAALPHSLAGISGPAVLLLGLAPHCTASVLPGLTADLTGVLATSPVQDTKEALQ